MWLPVACLHRSLQQTYPSSRSGHRASHRFDSIGGMKTGRAKKLLMLIASLSMTACATTDIGPPSSDEEPLVFDPQLFGSRPDIVSETQLFSLRESQKREFLGYFNDPANQEVAPHERVYDYLLLKTSDFDFHNDTRTASEVLDSSSGNCLSLAILTTAFADLVNVDTGYQLVDSTPVFERRGNVVSKGVHVRSILYDPTWSTEDVGGSARSTPGIRFDYFPDDTQRVRLIGNLTPSAYVAMYYSNVAGEAIARGDDEAAFWYLLESLEKHPDNAIALNMLAVVYRRVGDTRMAERIYQHGIENLPGNVSLLRNYRFLLAKQGRHTEADALTKILAELDDRNPFSWVNAGRRALADAEYQEAIDFLKKAIDRAPYLHEAYALKAIAYLKLGDKERGERNLRSAFENAQRFETRSMYQAKLTMFNRESR